MKFLDKVGGGPTYLSMELLEDSVIDLSNLCPELAELYLQLRPYIEVAIRHDVPDLGWWITIWTLIDDELSPTQEGPEESILLDKIPVINGTLADLHKRITEARLTMVLSYSDYISLPVLWKLLVEIASLDELIEKLDQQLPYIDLFEKCDYNEQRALDKALDESENWHSYQQTEMITKRLEKFDQTNFEWEYSESDEDLESEEAESEEAESEEAESEEDSDQETMRAARLKYFDS